MEQITVGNIQIDIVRKDIKNLHLAVYPPTGRVRIATPLSIDDEAVRLFAISKLHWIKKHQKSLTILLLVTMNGGIENWKDPSENNFSHLSIGAFD